MPSVEAELAARLARSEEVVLATVIKLDGAPPSHAGAKLLMTRTAALAGTLGCSEFDAAALADAPAVAEKGTPQLRTYRHELGSIEAYLEPHRPSPSLVVFGATPIARELLRWGPDLGFHTFLVETRPERLEGQAWGSTVGSLEALEPLLGPDVYAVLTDHDAPDVLAALEVLARHRPRFIGLVGSRRHTGHHIEALRARGAGDDLLARIQSPVGLDVGAVSPSEIALSILAGVVARRRGREGGWLEVR
jgi:xanthine dehydrogenase accessory factor